MQDSPKCYKAPEIGAFALRFSVKRYSTKNFFGLENNLCFALFFFQQETSEKKSMKMVSRELLYLLLHNLFFENNLIGSEKQNEKKGHTLRPQILEKYCP